MRVRRLTIVVWDKDYVCAPWRRNRGWNGCHWVVSLGSADVSVTKTYGAAGDLLRYGETLPRALHVNAINEGCCTIMIRNPLASWTREMLSVRCQWKKRIMITQDNHWNIDYSLITHFLFSYIQYIEKVKQVTFKETLTLGFAGNIHFDVPSALKLA